MTAEGDSGTTPLSFTVSLTAPDSKPVSVAFATADGSARTPDDYQATSGSLKFNPGETSKTVTVPIRGDTLNETDETLSLLLSSPSNAVLGRTQAFGVIADNEQSPQGYWFVAADGGVFAFGDARFFGSTGGMRLQPADRRHGRRRPRATATGSSRRDGGIFAFGDAAFFGSTGDIRLNQPIVGMAADAVRQGLLVRRRRRRHLRLRRRRLLRLHRRHPPAQPIVGMAATPSGKGYWLCAPVTAPSTTSATPVTTGRRPSRLRSPASSRAGAATATGCPDLTERSTPSVTPVASGAPGNLAQPVVGSAASPKGGGYWLVARDGGIFAFGDSRFYGSTGNIRLNQPIVGMTATSAR